MRERLAGQPSSTYRAGGRVRKIGRRPFPGAVAAQVFNGLLYYGTLQVALGVNGRLLLVGLSEAINDVPLHLGGRMSFTPYPSPNPGNGHI